VTGRERFGGANNFPVARLKLWLIPQEGNLDRRFRIYKISNRVRGKGLNY